MWIYYGIIVLSVVMFGGGFGLQELYRKKRGSGLKISMESACIGTASGLAILFGIGGFSFEYTPFTLWMAVLSALIGMAFTFCAFGALDSINLSLFSLYTMLGGMLLPFFLGIFFYGEAFSVGKIVCIIFIALALLCTLERGKKKGGAVYYIGIFILNGMSGVIAKIFASSDLPKTSAAGFSIWCAAATVLLSGTSWFILSLHGKRTQVPEKTRTEPRVLLRSYGIGALMGAMNKVANFLLVLSLSYVDASVQYPMVTGGTMIVSTVLSCFGDKKPTKREMISVCLAFVGLLALFLIPEKTK